MANKWVSNRQPSKTLTTAKFAGHHQQVEMFPIHKQKAKFWESRKPTAYLILRRRFEQSTLATPFLFMEKATYAQGSSGSLESVGVICSKNRLFVSLCSSAFADKIQHAWEFTKTLRGPLTLSFNP